MSQRRNLLTYSTSYRVPHGQTQINGQKRTTTYILYFVQETPWTSRVWQTKTKSIYILYNIQEPPGPVLGCITGLRRGDSSAMADQD